MGGIGILILRMNILLGLIGMSGPPSSHPIGALVRRTASHCSHILSGISFEKSHPEIKMGRHERMDVEVDILTMI